MTTILLMLILIQVAHVSPWWAASAVVVAGLYQIFVIVLLGTTVNKSDANKAVIEICSTQSRNAAIFSYAALAEVRKLTGGDGAEAVIEPDPETIEPEPAEPAMETTEPSPE